MRLSRERCRAAGAGDVSLARCLRAVEEASCGDSHAGGAADCLSSRQGRECSASPRNGRIGPRDLERCDAFSIKPGGV